MTISVLAGRGGRVPLLALLWGVFSTLTPLGALAAGTVALAWDPSSGTNVIAGYKIYYGAASRAYTNVTSAGTATTMSISNLVGGKTYYFAATAIDAFGLESDYSTEASALISEGATNQPPTLNLLFDVTLNENAGLHTVSLSGITSGASNEAQTLTVTAASSNPSLIPTPAVSYTSPDTTGAISFTPVANSFGFATITVTVNDGGASNNLVSRSFTATVNPVNQPPTLDPLANLTLNENAGPQGVSLSGITSGAANESQTLTVTAISSNPSLIPTPSIAYTSPNTAGTLTFIPVANASGAATLTVTVNDGGSSNNVVSRSFTVTLNPVNQPPTLDAPADITLNENTGLQTVNLSGITSGATNEAQTLTVTAASSNPSLIPDPAINYTSPDTTGSLTFTPVTSAYGSATITVTVDDGSASNNVVTRSFLVTVVHIDAKPDCTYAFSLSPTGFTASAASGTFSISTGSNCAWSVVAPAWVALSSTNGAGAYAGTFTVETNTGSLRTGLVTLIGGVTNLSYSLDQQASVTKTEGLAPTVSITSPTSGQTVSNAVVTLTGAARDNVLVSTVWYQLNGGEWTLGQVGNGSTNWTASVTLAPGTNTVKVFAVDTSGNRSTTNTVNFTYILTAPLNLAVVGSGRVTGATNGQPLAIDKTVRLTTTASRGSVLTNWLVQVNGLAVISTNRALPFVMQSNLVVTATFVDVQKPVLTITSPGRIGQRWSNAVFTVAGKVTDNGPLSAVSYQLNGGDWTIAQTTNGWSTWTANVTLVPGLNTVKAYAVDAAGNQSATNTANLTYVLTAPLNLAVVGSGRVAGATNGQLLEIGKTVSLMASPARGYVLTNWLVQVDGLTVISTNRPLPFTMQSNLVLTATFVDVQKPMLTITSPALTQCWSNAVFTVAGQVADNGPLSTVSYQLNGGNWTVAQTINGWSNWTASVTLVPGLNTVKACAVDAAGNRSATNSANLTYVLTTPLNLAVLGSGRVTGATNGQRLEIGKTVSLMASPARGYVLTNWLVQVDGLTVISTNRPLPFTMQSNLVLTATFVDVQKPMLTITSPAFTQRGSNAVFTVAGKVTDNGPLSTVSYQLNDGDWTPAQTTNGWHNWIANVTLVPGTNTIKAYALDAAGNQSATDSVRLTYLPAVLALGAQAQAVSAPQPQFAAGQGSLSVSNGHLQMQLSGAPGAVVVVEGSPDLVHWLPIQTNTVPAEGLSLSMPMNQQPALFFRARLLP